MSLNKSTERLNEVWHRVEKACEEDDIDYRHEVRRVNTSLVRGLSDLLVGVFKEYYNTTSEPSLIYRFISEDRCIYIECFITGEDTHECFLKVDENGERVLGFKGTTTDVLEGLEEHLNREVVCK